MLAHASVVPNVPREACDSEVFSGSVIQPVLDRQHRGQFNLGKIGPLREKLPQQAIHVFH